MIKFRTQTGQSLDLENPCPDHISIWDIAEGLSKCCRFAGQIEDFYSVAQHSVMVSRLVPPEARLAALLHDGSEAYIGDVSRDFKRSRFMVGYRTIEQRLQDAIYSHFGQDETHTFWRTTIKAADDLAAIWERSTLRLHQPFAGEDDIDQAITARFVMSSKPLLMSLLPGLLPVFAYPYPWPFEEARVRFFHEYMRLQR